MLKYRNIVYIYICFVLGKNKLGDWFPITLFTSWEHDKSRPGIEEQGMTFSSLANINHILSLHKCSDGGDP